MAESRFSLARTREFVFVFSVSDHSYRYGQSANYAIPTSYFRKNFAGFARETFSGFGGWIRLHSSVQVFTSTWDAALQSSRKNPVLQQLRAITVEREGKCRLTLGGTDGPEAPRAALFLSVAVRCSPKRSNCVNRNKQGGNNALDCTGVLIDRPYWPGVRRQKSSQNEPSQPRHDETTSRSAGPACKRTSAKSGLNISITGLLQNRAAGQPAASADSLQGLPHADPTTPYYVRLVEGRVESYSEASVISIQPRHRKPKHDRPKHQEVAAI